DNKLAFNGTIRVVDGSYQAYGQPLKIDRGEITFSGPIDRPRLDIEATRPKLEDIRVGVKITGSAATPRVRLFSEPDMSEVDKLSWLVMGHASDKAGRTESALLQRAALALVSGEGPGVTDKVTAALGLDELSLGQTDGEVKQTVLTVGKQLSDRVSVGYEQGLNATVGSFQLIYRIASRFTLRAQTGEDNAIDLIWTWRWQ
ncbi:MAG: translocation/assembly module TamB domain-containing protein, partial [Burkholderiaceae bacterium]